MSAVHESANVMADQAESLCAMDGGSPSVLLFAAFTEALRRETAMRERDDKPKLPLYGSASSMYLETLRNTAARSMKGARAYNGTARMGRIIIATNDMMNCASAEPPNAAYWHRQAVKALLPVMAELSSHVYDLAQRGKR